MDLCWTLTVLKDLIYLYLTVYKLSQTHSAKNKHINAKLSQQSQACKGFKSTVCNGLEPDTLLVVDHNLQLETQFWLLQILNL